MLTSNVALPKERAHARAKWLSYLERDSFLGYALVAPALLILTLFIAYPFVLGIRMSLSHWLVGQEPTFVGLQNFVRNADSTIFTRTVQNTFIYTAAATVLKLAFGMALALVLNNTFRGKGMVRAAFLLPWIIPTVLSTLAWLWMFDATFSVINWCLRYVGLVQRGINWLGDPVLAMLSIIVVNSWRGVPFFAISLLAGLQTISPELYEAAAIDGANAAQRFRYITLPMIKPVLLVVLLFSIIWTFADFQLVYVLTRGGPANSTHLFATLAYQVGVVSGSLGEGAAVSLTLFPILVVVVVVLLFYLRKE
ncbi:MAG: sugar ABC transporter permease [Nitrospinae bacterium]|nr:sugar ABC transporter permease [Nitrospinota bacterium]